MLRTSIAHLRTWRRGERRAPHKPLLLLYALGRVQRGAARLVEFSEADPVLKSLLDRFGPGRGSTHPLLPFWYLKNDRVWELPRSDHLPRRSNNKEPLVSAVRDHGLEGGFPAPIFALLSSRPGLVVELANSILCEHFPESLHCEIASAAGLELTAPQRSTTSTRLARPYGFRDEVLRAYGYRCAVCGFRALLDGAAIGVEAAHLKWHAFGGPSTLTNGLALCILHHKLLDLGVLGLSPDREVLVSARLTSEDETAQLLLRHHGKPLAQPQPGLPPVSTGFTDWHRGQVFKSPARAAAS